MLFAWLVILGAALVLHLHMVVVLVLHTAALLLHTAVALHTEAVLLTMEEALLTVEVLLTEVAPMLGVPMAVLESIAVGMAVCNGSVGLPLTTIILAIVVGTAVGRMVLELCPRCSPRLITWLAVDARVAVVQLMMRLSKLGTFTKIMEGM